MTGTRKVKDFFIDRKIPLFLRGRIPLLFSGEVLMWVCGQRVSEAGRVQSGIHVVAEVEIPEFNQ
jgi:tRNA(Ile)-lysidine synthase